MNLLVLLRGTPDLHDAFDVKICVDMKIDTTVGR